MHVHVIQSPVTRRGARFENPRLEFHSREGWGGWHIAKSIRNIVPIILAVLDLSRTLRHAFLRFIFHAFEQAVEGLLDKLAINPSDDAVKQLLIQAFALMVDRGQVSRYRRRMSSLLF